MNHFKYISIVFAGILLVFIVAPGRADAAPFVHTYTSRTLFLADVSKSLEIAGFEGIPAGTMYPNGSLVDGVIVEHSEPLISILVTDSYYQTSPGGRNTLALDTIDQAFLSGDSCSFFFTESVLAFGINVIGSPGDVRPGDFTLFASSTDVSNGEIPDDVLPDGGEVYFLGVFVESANPGSMFNQASLESKDPAGDGLFVFNLDDITISRQLVEGTGYLIW